MNPVNPFKVTLSDVTPGPNCEAVSESRIPLKKFLVESEMFG